MKATLETVRFISCPNCGRRGSSIDHLKPGADFGPWHCDNLACRTAFVGKVTEDGADIEIYTREGDNIPRLTLLKFRDLYFVLLDKYGCSNPDYFYHSHQCPTNLLNNVIEVFDAEHKDPHGLMRYVAEMPWSEEAQNELQEEMGSLAALFAFFKTDGQPAATDWPEENGGVLPFIAEARREYQRKRSPKA